MCISAWCLSLSESRKMHRQKIMFYWPFIVFSIRVFGSFTYPLKCDLFSLIFFFLVLILLLLFSSWTWVGCFFSVCSFAWRSFFLYSLLAFLAPAGQNCLCMSTGKISQNVNRTHVLWIVWFLGRHDVFVLLFILFFSPVFVLVSFSSLASFF